MKKVLMLAVASIFIFSSADSYAAWGQKKTTEAKPVQKVEKKVVTPVKDMAQAAAPAQAPQTVIRFESLVNILLKEENAAQLGLSEEQKQTITKIKTDLQNELKAIRTKFNSETEAVRQEFAAKIEPFKQSMQTATNDVKQTKVTELNQTLSKEQQQKLAQIISGAKKN